MEKPFVFGSDAGKAADEKTGSPTNNVDGGSGRIGELAESGESVQSFFDVFNLKELLEQANEKEVMILPALGYCKAVTIRIFTPMFFSKIFRITKEIICFIHA